MLPNSQLITIKDNLNHIKGFLKELVLEPRLNAIKWAAITKQTPNIKIGYPGQHLASLITGMEGERTGARGNDLVDGSEVKSCSRIDQLDKCQLCKSSVARLEKVCHQCGSNKIKRNNDSKWLFAVRNEDELALLLYGVKRILLLLGDYPNFNQEDFNTLRFQAFELWPEHSRNIRFSEIITNYYHKIYLAHKRKDPNKTPAPKNFWPYTYQFYICNPILTFLCIVHNANDNPKIEITHYVEPHIDRSNIPSISMPTDILNAEELDLVIDSTSIEALNSVSKKPFIDKIKLKSLPRKEKLRIIPYLDEKLRQPLVLRDTDKISTAKTKYTRRNIS